MEIAALTILLLFALIGFAAIFFTTFGTLVIFLGALFYAFLTDFSVINTKVLLILFMLYLCGEVSEYLFIIIGAKRFGASNRAVVASLVGGILGGVLGAAGFLGLGLLLGTFLGIFLGAFLAELSIKQDLIKSLKAGAGGAIGRIGSIAAKVVIAVIMFAVMALRIFGSS